MTRAPRRAIPWRRRSVFALITTAAFLLTLEAGARFYFGVLHGRTVHDAIFTPCYRHYFFLGPSFKPNAECAWQGIAHMKINSLGFRGDEVTIAKPAGTFRIVTWGGSTSHAGNYPLHLARRFADARRYGYERIEVVNAAVPTWTSTQSLIQFVTRVVYLRPDMVLVLDGINNAHMHDAYWLTNLPRVDYEAYGGFLTNHSLLYNLARNGLARLRQVGAFAAWRGDGVGGAMPAPTPPSTQVFETDLAHLITLARSHGTDVALITMPLNHSPGVDPEESARRAGYAYRDYGVWVARMAVINDVTRRLAARSGVLLIDAAARTELADARNFVDLCHFTERGAGEFAALVHGALDRHLGAQRGSGP